MELTIEGARRVRTGAEDKVMIEIPAPYLPHYRQFLSKEKPEAVYRVTLDNSRRRSTGRGSQNNHLHGHCQQIAQATGGTVGSVKSGIRWAAADQREYPMVEVLGGRKEPKPDAEANTYEAYLLIETAHQIAAEMGIALIEAPYSEGWEIMRREAVKMAAFRILDGEDV